MLDVEETLVPIWATGKKGDRLLVDQRATVRGPVKKEEAPPRHMERLVICTSVVAWAINSKATLLLVLKICVA